MRMRARAATPDLRVLEFTTYGRPEPQGSSRAFIVGGKARITSANSKMKPFRSEVTRSARAAVHEAGWEEPMFAKHVPVNIEMRFSFAPPASAPKHREYPVVKPDIDKLQRAILDALTGVAFADDAQVVVSLAHKVHDAVQGVSVVVRKVGG